jgi:iron complex transport system substrate-binding protein
MEGVLEKKMETMYRTKGVIFFLCLSLFVLLFLSGCVSNQGEEILSPKKPRAIHYPVTVKDQTGKVVQIPKEPKRIVSLVPSTTEIAFALKLDHEVVAVTENDDYPPEVKKLPKVGSMQIDIEQVLAQKPDLVLASTANDPKTIERLRQLNLPVLVTAEGQTIKQILQAIQNVALATNRAWEAEQLIARIHRQMRETYGKVVHIPKEKRVKVWIEIGPELYTIGGDGFLNEMVHMAGGVNVAENEKGWPKISSEQVVKWQPDVIISVYPGGEEEIRKRKGWESIPAIQKNRVYSVDPNLLSRPGPRVSEGIIQLAKRFYPEKFGEETK